MAVVPICSWPASGVAGRGRGVFDLPVLSLGRGNADSDHAPGRGNPLLARVQLPSLRTQCAGQCSLPRAISPRGRAADRWIIPSAEGRFGGFGAVGLVLRRLFAPELVQRSAGRKRIVPSREGYRRRTP